MVLLNYFPINLFRKFPLGTINFLDASERCRNFNFAGMIFCKTEILKIQGAGPSLFKK